MEEETRRLKKKMSHKKKKIHKKPVHMQRMIKFLLVLLLIPVVFFTSLLFVKQSTVIKITPVIKTAQYTDAVFTAKQSTIDNLHNSKALAYAILPLSLNESQDVDIKDHTFITKKAEGIITIYNAFSTKKQKLINNTRFISDDGKIYKIHKAVFIPGKKNGIAGKIQAKVYADKPGTEYNKISGKLSIPGLKKYPNMYNSLYAKITTQIQGGNNGQSAVIDDVERRTATAWLQEQITKKVYTEIEKKITKEQIYFKDGVSILFDDVLESDKGDVMKLTQNAKISAIIFNKNNFAKEIAAGIKGDPKDGQATIVAYDALTVHINKLDIQNKREDIHLVVNGKTNIAWYPNSEKIKKALTGQKRTLFESLLMQYPSIEKATVINRPFWNRKFPKNLDDITVNIVQ